MDDGLQQNAPTGTPEAPAPRSMPMAAVAGAIVLIGLVAFGLYRRNATLPAPDAPPEAAPAATPAAGEAGTADPGAIKAQLPIRLTPEASILAERYRCVCGCNDTLSVCTCRNDRGSEEMKGFLQKLVTDGTTPEKADAAMAEKFGTECLLSNPAPPQTLPSHAHPERLPPPAPKKKP
jgi:hypothetical protein